MNMVGFSLIRYGKTSRCGKDSHERRHFCLTALWKQKARHTMGTKQGASGLVRRWEGGNREKSLCCGFSLEGTEEAE
jgi:hypothetical protein